MTHLMKDPQHRRLRRALHIGLETFGGAERERLEAHLSECAECRAYAAEVRATQAGLRQMFRARWDADTRLLRSRTWEPTPMKPPMSAQLRAAAGGLAVMVIVFLVFFGLLSSLRPNEGQVPGNADPTVTPAPLGTWATTPPVIPMLPVIAPDNAAELQAASSASVREVVDVVFLPFAGRSIAALARSDRSGIDLIDLDTGARGPASALPGGDRLSVARTGTEALLAINGPEGLAGIAALTADNNGVSARITPPPVTSPLHSAVLSPDGRFLATATFEQAVTLWAASPEAAWTEVMTMPGYGPLAFSRDGSLLALADLSGNASISLWDTASRQPLRILSLPADNQVLALDFSPDGSQLAVGGNLGRLVIFDVQTGEQSLDLADFDSRIFSVAYSPDGRLLATGHEYEGLHVWETATGREVLALTSFPDPVQQVSFNPDGTRLAISWLGGDGAAVEFLALGPPTAIASPQPVTQPVTDVLVSPTPAMPTPAPRDDCGGWQPLTATLTTPEVRVERAAFYSGGCVELVFTSDEASLTSYTAVPVRPDEAPPTCDEPALPPERIFWADQTPFEPGMHTMVGAMQLEIDSALYDRLVILMRVNGQANPDVDRWFCAQTVVPLLIAPETGMPSGPTPTWVPPVLTETPVSVLCPASRCVSRFALSSRSVTKR